MEQKSKISGYEFAAMIIVAATFDIIGIGLNIIGFLPIVGQIIAWPLTIVNSFIGYVVFGIWFAVSGIGFLNPRRFITGLSSVVIELIPVLNALPTLTIGVFIIIFSVWAEEKLGINTHHLTPKLPLQHKK